MERQEADSHIATAQTSDRDFEPRPIVEIDVLISLSNPIGIRGWTLPQKKTRTNISICFFYTTHVIVELQLIEVLSSDVWPLEGCFEFTFCENDELQLCRNVGQN